MRVLLAPDRFGPDLTPSRVAAVVADGWRAGAPHDELDVAPLGDGGPGLVEAVHTAVGGELVPRTVLGADGAVVPVVLLRLGDGTVLAEAAQVLGAAVVGAAPAGADGASTGDRAPVGTGPVAALLDHALDLDPVRVVVGVGGLTAHDAGAGLLAALGLDRPALRAGGAALVAVAPADLAGLGTLLEAQRGRFGRVALEVAADVEVPLLGLHGASALLAVPDATVLRVAPDAAQGLERAFGHWVHLLGTVLGPGRVRELAGAHGAGAGGGLAFGLSLLGARVRPGAEVVAELVGLDARAASADLVLTVTAVLDPHELHDSSVAACSRAAAEHALPVVVLTGEAVMGRREHAAQGLAGVYPLVEGGRAWRELADPGAALRERATRVARTWSR